MISMEFLNQQNFLYVRYGTKAREDNERQRFPPDNDYCDVIANSKRHSSLDFYIKHIIGIDRPPEIFYRDFLHSSSHSNQLFIASHHDFLFVLWKAVDFPLFASLVHRRQRFEQSEICSGKCFKFRLCRGAPFV